jgi:hypothetical protein
MLRPIQRRTAWAFTCQCHLTVLVQWVLRAPGTVELPGFPLRTQGSCTRASLTVSAQMTHQVRSLSEDFSFVCLVLFVCLFFSFDLVCLINRLIFCGCIYTGFILNILRKRFVVLLLVVPKA